MATNNSVSTEGKKSVRIPTQIIKKLRSGTGGLATILEQIKKEFDVGVSDIGQQYQLTGTDEYYLELVIATLDHKYVKPSAPENGVIQLIEDKKVKWKFYGQDAILLKNMFDRELENLKTFEATVRGLNKKPIVVEISCTPKLRPNVEHCVKQLVNCVSCLHKEKIEVKLIDEPVARQFAASPQVGDKSSYINYNSDTKKRQLQFFGKTEESLKNAVDKWQKKSGGGKQTSTGRPDSAAKINSKKYVTNVDVKQNSGGLHRNEGAKLQMGENTSQVHLHNPQMIVPTAPDHTSDISAAAKGQTAPRVEMTSQRQSIGTSQAITNGATGGVSATQLHTSVHDQTLPTQSPRKETYDQGHYTGPKDNAGVGHGTQLSTSTFHRSLPKPSHREETRGQGHSGHVGSAGVGHTAGTAFNYEFYCGTMAVKVYNESITDIRGMDAIVNAANEKLEHGGGVAYYISKAAGVSMDTECHQFVSKQGPLSVTKNFVSIPGHMNCKSIIHAVGPQWYDYVDAQENCAEDLYKTIMNILEEAGKWHYMKIAMPAISAGIYGVPKPLCARMYVKAFIDFARRSPGRIAEVHFIDIDPGILGLVKAAYEESLRNPNSLDFQNARKYPSTRRPAPSTAHHSGDPGTKYPPTKTSTSTTVTFRKEEMTSYGARMSTFLVGTRVAVHVYTGSIVKLQKLDGIVCAVDGYQLMGRLAGHILQAAGDKYRKAVDAARKRGVYSDGDVIVTEAGQLRVRKVLHVVVQPAVEMTTRFKKLLQLYNRQVLEKANSEKIKKVAMPLLACGSLRGHDIRLGCAELVNSIVDYCMAKGDRGLNITDIHLVNMDEGHTDLLCKLLRSEAGLEGSYSDRETRGSYQAANQFSTSGTGRGAYGQDHQGHGQFSTSGTGRGAYGQDHQGHGQFSTSGTGRGAYGQDHQGHGQFSTSGTGRGAYGQDHQGHGQFSTSGTGRGAYGQDHQGHGQSSTSGTDGGAYSQGHHGHGQSSTDGGAYSQGHHGHGQFGTSATNRGSHGGQQASGQSHASGHSGSYGGRLPDAGTTSEWQTHTPSHVDTTKGVTKAPAKVAKPVKPNVEKTKPTGRCEFYEQCKAPSSERLPCGHEYCSACISVLGKDKKCLKCSDGDEATHDDATHDEVTQEDGDCAICMDKLTDPESLPCGHVFCGDCLQLALAQKPVCPLCSAVVGTMVGNQPDGTMRYRILADSLPGYKDYGTIEIFYNFPDGTQKKNHPYPGQPYRGTKRSAYLPDNKDGSEIFELLKTAYDRKLTFTIGDSRTTGKSNVVTFNDIHHKTKQYGGPEKFGYPDPTYLHRVREELAAKGVS